jgi:hypothetical protein
MTASISQIITLEEFLVYPILNLQARQLECYSQPYQDAQGEFNYLNKQIFLANHSVE